MLTVIGCGNVLRRDDGVGVQLARRLAARLAEHPIAGVQAIDCGTAGFEVMYRARGSAALIIVDAARTGGAPGAIYEVPGDVVAAVALPEVNLHAFRWDHAIGVGRAVYQGEFPADVAVWLIEAADLDYGEALSPAVAAAAEVVYRRVLDRIAGFATAAAARAAAAPIALVAERGSLQLPAAVFGRWFGDRTAATVLPDGRGLVLLPVHPEQGGVVVKQKNRHGDRAIELREALRARGWDDVGTLHLRAVAEPSVGGWLLTPAAPPDDAAAAAAPPGAPR